MSERLFQARLFDTQPQDVTPRGFTHLSEVNRRAPGPTPEMGRFVREVKGPDRVHILSPGLAAEYLMTHIYTPFATFDQEELWVLLLNNKNLVTHEAMVYRGTVNSAYIRPAEIFKPAVQLNSPTLIISHNHPSGDPSPSPEDIHITRNLVEVGRFIDIEIADHIIIGVDRWVSLKEGGLGFE